MASEYTTHYNLDLYTDIDKPNLRDQYNGAMNKIDSQLNTLSNNFVVVTEAANQAKEKADSAFDSASAYAQSISTLQTTVSGIDTAYKAADSSITDAYKAADTKLSSDITAAYTAADTKLSTDITAAYKAADTKLSTNITAAYKAADSTLAAHFPIRSDDIAAGAITRDKLDAQALESLTKGTTIRHFDSKDSSADNVGMNVPNNDVVLSGFYLPELTMLVINMFHVPAGTPVETFFGATTSFRLPSYVPHTTANNIKLNGIGIKSTPTNDFAGWTGIGLNKDGYIGTNSGVTSDYAFDMAGSIVVFLRAYGVA